MKRSVTSVQSRGSVMLGVAGALLLASGGVLVGYFVHVQSASASAEAAAEDPVEPSAPEKVEAAAREFLKGELQLRFADQKTTVTWSDVGAQVDPDVLDRARVDDSGELTGFVPVRLERQVALDLLTNLKEELDRPPRDARMDLEKRTVHEGVPGLGLDVYGSVSAIEAAARRGEREVELEGAEVPPAVTVEDLGIQDISHVLAEFKTRFSVRKRSRNDNLKLVASHIDGHVMQPDEVFSFNEVVGARSEKEGYKTAGVILKGELVDGMAGGACQISTTLHGAAFFAGLDIVESRPHSRPSTYVHMGLDATVVYPQVDLKLKNPYDFPIAIHYRVARGVARVEILGKERPYDKIAFERNVKKRIPFETVTREDDGIPIGHMVVDQAGYPGYKVLRERKFYKDGEVVDRDRWNLRYRPVVEYVRMGVNPDPNLPAPESKKAKGPRPASGRFRMVQ